MAWRRPGDEPLSEQMIVDSNDNLAKKRKKKKSEYLRFAKIAWMAPGS